MSHFEPGPGEGVPSAKRRVLFVDDEPHVLDGLRNRLRRHRRKWDVAFASGGEEALREMEKEPFDVVVTDMRMPGMDGAALLERVQARYPATVRIVLSGQAELASTLRAVPVAHQYLSKPCEGQQIEEAIERSCQLHAMLHDEGLRRVVGGSDGLPSLPRVYGELTEALKDPDVSIRDIARIIEQDIAMSAKILKLVNSAFFGLPQKVTGIERAVSYLGTKMVRSLALTAHLFEGQAVPRIPGFDLEAIHRHSFLAARVAKELFESREQGEDAFAAAVLHDVGKIVLAARLPREMGAALAAARGEGRPLAEVEKERLGVSHGEVGGLLLGIWGLPYPVVEAVAYHHEPSRVAASGFDILGAVHVADALAAEVEGGGRAPLDLCYLARIGVAERLPGWTALAEEHGRAIRGKG